MMKVLVVSGSRVERQAIVVALAVLDHVTVQGAVADIKSTLRALIEGHPDVIVTSVALDNGTGLELIRAVRRLDRAIPIVVIAEAPSRDDWRLHLEAGADRFVARDPELDELQDVLAALVHPRRDRAPSVDRSVTEDLRTSLAALQLLFEKLKEQPHDESLWRQIEVAMDRTAIRLTNLVRDRVCP